MAAESDERGTRERERYRERYAVLCGAGDPGLSHFESTSGRTPPFMKVATQCVMKDEMQRMQPKCVRALTNTIKHGRMDEASSQKYKGRNGPSNGCARRHSAGAYSEETHNTKQKQQSIRRFIAVRLAADRFVRR